MKSLQVMNVIPQDEWKDYSDLQVLISGAGWYIGTIHHDPEFHFDEPGSRDTYYFRSEEDAKRALDAIEKLYLVEHHEVSIWTIDRWLIANFPEQQGVGYRLTP